MQTKRLIGVALAALALGAAAAPAAMARDEGKGVKVGTLTCDVEKGWGQIVTSAKDLTCYFQPTGRDKEVYTGELKKYGVDVGYTGGGAMVWQVIAPTSNVAAGSLEGKYGGATAGATVGLGVGANVLIGGLDKSIALQPVSLEGNSGLALSAGIGFVELKHQPDA